MELPVCVVDAFAEKPFAGNPAAVVFLDGARLGKPVLTAYQASKRGGRAFTTWTGLLRAGEAAP